jgi:hypothetical protein
MLYLSEILLQNHDLENFDELVKMVEDKARGGELFFQMDVRPPFLDTPEGWEDKLEAAFAVANKL